MKRLSKKIIFYTLLFAMITSGFLIFQTPVLAAPGGSMIDDKLWKVPDIKITIPGMKKLSEVRDCSDAQGRPGKCVPWIGEYIVGVYNFATAIVGILAAIMIIIGGARWLTAGGDAGAVTEAQNIIKGALMGLILTMTSYTVLNLINPKLTSFGEGIRVAAVMPQKPLVGDEVGCCEKTILTEKCENLSKKADCAGASWYKGKGYFCGKSDDEKNTICRNDKDPCLTKENYKSCLTLGEGINGYCLDGKCEGCKFFGETCVDNRQCSIPARQCGIDGFDYCKDEICVGKTPPKLPSAP